METFWYRLAQVVLANGWQECQKCELKFETVDASGFECALISETAVQTPDGKL